MPALADSTIPALGGLGCIPEHTLLDSCTRLSVSLEDSVFKVFLNDHFKYNHFLLINNIAQWSAYNAINWGVMGTIVA